MKSTRLITSSVRTLCRYRLRTFFMSIGIVIGVASLVMGRSMGAGAEKDFQEKVDKIFGPGTIIVIARSKSSTPPTGPITTLKIEDLQAVADRLEAIVDWDPTVGVGGVEIQYGDRNRELVVFGHSERAERVWNRSVVAGRFFTSEDLQSAARVALIGTNVAASLFDGDDPIGKEILIRSMPFRVVGVLESIGIDPHGMDRDDDVMVPTTTAMRRMRNIDYIGSAKLVVRDPEKVDEDAEAVAEILRERHHIGAGEDDDFHTFTSRYAGRRAAEANKVMRWYVPAAAGIVLLLAAIVITNVMLTTIRQRLPEIGLRRAVGATAASISRQFLAETVAVSLLSGVVGLALGVVAAWVATRFFGQPTALSPGLLVMAYGAALLVGVLAGLLPARKAAQLDPVEGLRQFGA